MQLQPATVITLRTAIALVALCGLGTAQAALGQTVRWTSQFGAAGFDAIYAVDDADGDVYGVGETNTGPFAADCSESDEDAIVRKYRGSGRVQWTRRFGSVTASGTTGCDIAEAVAAQSEGVYVGGFVEGELPGQITRGDFDAYIRRYDEDGDELWSRQFGSTGADRVAGAAADESGVYVAGQACGALENQQRVGPCDAFVRKYTRDGSEGWTRQFGANGFAMANEIDVQGNAVVVIGRVAGSLPGQEAAGGRDVFVRKYDAEGDELWTRQFGTVRDDIAWGIDIEGDALYVVGDVGGALPGQTYAGGPSDAFIRKYDAEGNLVWTRQPGTGGFDRAIRVAADATNVVAVGRAGGVLPNARNAFTREPYTYAGGFTDSFVMWFDPSGNAGWTVQFGSAESSEAATGVALEDHGGDPFVSGGAGGTLPGHESAGFIDAFVMKLLSH